MSVERTVLSGIQSRDWEHPSDRAALSVLSSVPGLPELFRLVGGLTSDRALRLTWMASAVKAGPLQIPAAWNAVTEACRVLDVPSVPEVFVAPGWNRNAQLMGFETPFLVLGGNLVETLNEDELLAVVGHELGHLKAGHAVYRTLAFLLSEASLRALPGGEWVQLPVSAALQDWSRKSELSCDRAGLLACQNPAAALSALIKVGYPGLSDRIDSAELDRQAAEWDSTGDVLDSVFKVLGLWNASHPALVLRYAALKTWSTSADYSELLAGRRRPAETLDPGLELKRAWETWRADVSRSQDPGTRLIADGLRQVEAWLDQLWKR